MNRMHAKKKRTHRGYELIPRVRIVRDTEIDVFDDIKQVRRSREHEVEALDELILLSKFPAGPVSDLSKLTREDLRGGNWDIGGSGGYGGTPTTLGAIVHSHSDILEGIHCPDEELGDTLQSLGGSSRGTGKDERRKLA